MRRSLHPIVYLLAVSISACSSDSVTAPNPPSITLDRLYAKINASGPRARLKYATLGASSNGCLFATTHPDGSFQGIPVAYMFLPFHLPSINRARGRAGQNRVVSATLALPGVVGSVNVSCPAGSDALEAELKSLVVDPTNPKGHSILVGLAKQRRAEALTAPPMSDEVAAVRREVLGYETA